MKRFLPVFCAALLCLLLAPSAASAADEGYYFESIHTRVRVNLDHSVDVVKEIRVNFTQEKHGLYWYLNSNWDNTRLQYYNIDIEGAPYEVQRSADHITFKIGDPDYIVTGYKDYIIRYSINPGKDHTEALDALYMNVQEHEHPCPVMETSFTVMLPSPVEPSYIGVITGSTEHASSDDPIDYEYAGDTLTGVAKRPLSAYEGITVKIDLPEGYFSEAREPFGLRKTLAWLIPLICILLGSVLWYLYGRDPKFVIPVEVSPPDNISPAQAGYIIDGIVDNDDIASMLVYWASLGYMNIDERKKGVFTFIKQKDMGQERPKYEKKLFDSLFSDTSTEVGESEARTRLGGAVNSFMTSLKAKYASGKSALIDKISKKTSAFIMTLASVCLGAVGVLLGLGSTMAMVIFAVIALVFASILKSLVTTALNYGRKRRKFTNFLFLIAISALFIVIWFFVYGISYAENNPIPGWNFALLIFCGGYLIVASHFAKRMTEYGHRIFERVLGFRMFMITAHRERLETLAEDNPSFFYDRLPYALALGVSKAWIGKFSDIVTTPPTWYTGYHYTSFNMMYFTHAFTRTAVHVSTPIGTSSYRPGGSSFSSGGGFSGGGFSGGGSGSW